MPQANCVVPSGYSVGMRSTTESSTADVAVILRPGSVKPDWAERIDRAVEARRIGQELRRDVPTCSDVARAASYFPVK